jgi:hypothetical protein
MKMGEHLYTERVSSNRTEALFLVLMLLCLILSAWRMQASGMDTLTVVFFIFFLFFLFYALNYITLIIRVTQEYLELKFGLFTWRVLLAHIENTALDDTSLWRIGGAGIHFSPVHGRYRAMFNFLQYPRVVISLRKKKGPVKDIAFSTRYPEEIMRFIQEAVSKRNAAEHERVG